MIWIAPAQPICLLQSTAGVDIVICALFRTLFRISDLKAVSWNCGLLLTRRVEQRSGRLSFFRFSFQLWGSRAKCGWMLLLALFKELVCFWMENGPIFRPPTSDSVDALCRRGLKSGEATNLLREFLALNADGRDLNAVSSHSCKATVLSWSSKFGLDEYTRSVLGRHVSATVSSSALYARDLCIEPVRKLQELIKQIATGVFRPDAPRSEFFGAPISVVPTLVDEPCVTKDEHADELENEFIVISSDEDSTSDSSSSTCSDCSSSNPGSEAGQPIAKMPRLIPCDPKVGKWFTHKKSKISHFCRNFESLVSPVRLFVCGKRLNDNYEPVLPGKEPFADCMMCRRSAF